ncbi:hypothetical protein ACV35P_33810, partial [Pseudomonas aeruginosa]
IARLDFVYGQTASITVGVVVTGPGKLSSLLEDTPAHSCGAGIHHQRVTGMGSVGSFHTLTDIKIKDIRT